MTKFIKKILLYASILIVLNIGLGTFLRTYETQDLLSAKQFFPEMRWQEYYNLKDSIDLLILGSSHAYRSYDPQILSKQIEGNPTVFNFGSSAQSPITSYYVLEEVLQKHRPKLVIFDAYILTFSSNNLLKNGRYNLLPMKWGETKKAFFLKGFSFKEQVLMLLFPTYVYKNYLKGKIKKILGKKYLPKKRGNYQTMGFVSNPDTLAMEKLTGQNQFDYFDIELEKVTEKNLHYIKKMVNRCRELNIEMVFMTAPIPEISVQKIETYPAISDYFENLANELEVPYFDFNINRIPAIKDEFHYYDDDHLNKVGAEIYSKTITKHILSFQPN